MVQWSTIIIINYFSEKQPVKNANINPDTSADCYIILSMCIIVNIRNQTFVQLVYYTQYNWDELIIKGAFTQTP